LKLQNNGGDDLDVNGDGDFVFSKKVANGADYAVTVRTQPSNPAQTCTVDKGSGKISDQDVKDVAVNCNSDSFKIGGNVTGLAGATGLSLRNNGGDDLAVNADGGFTFPTAVKRGSAYAVTIGSQPSGHACAVTQASGDAGATVTNVVVTCAANLTVQAVASFARGVVSWNATGAMQYDL
jgi:hypothetical protein